MARIAVVFLSNFVELYRLAWNDFALNFVFAREVSETGFSFACSLAFMLVLDVLPWLFLVSFWVAISVVCRRCCYTVATWAMLGLSSLVLLVNKPLAELFWIAGLWQAI